MAKLTQKERRNRKQNKRLLPSSNQTLEADHNTDDVPTQEADRNTDDVPTQQIECAICMENINTHKSITLECGHTFHKTCLNDWNVAQLDGKPVSIITPLNTILKPDDPIVMTIHLNGTGLTKCACCRTEHTMIGDVDADGDLIPKKVLGKIRFAQFNGETPVQYITDPRDLVWYLPKNATSKMKFDMWRPVLMSLMAGIADGTSTEIDAMYCNCCNKNCSGMFLLNKEIRKICKGCEDPAVVTPMNVFKIQDCVADPKVVRKLFTNKFS